MADPRLELMRVGNGLMAGLGVVVAAGIASGGVPPVYSTFLAFLATFFILSGGNVVNDFFDVKVDKKNKPHRPLPSGRITEKRAVKLAYACFAAGLAASALLNIYCFVLAFTNTVLLVFYNKIKNLSFYGNFVVAFLVGSIFMFGGLAVQALNPSIYILSVLAALATLGREITKDIEDVDGDLDIKTTLSTIYGTDIAGKIGGVILLLVVLLSYWPSYYLGENYLFAVFFADAIFAYCAARLIFNAEKYAADVQRLQKGGMLLVLFAFIAGMI